MQREPKTARPPAKPSAPRPRRTQQERKDATRNQLIEATIDCVFEMGYAATTIAAVADKAGVTHGAIQHHFGNRDALMLAIVATLRDKLYGQAKNQIPDGMPISERISAICEQYWRVVNSRHFIAAVQIQLGASSDLEFHAHVLATMQKAERELDRRWLELFADLKSPPDQLMAARHLALATLRGLSIRKMHRTRKDGWEKERTMLHTMLTHALRETPGHTR